MLLLATATTCSWLRSASCPISGAQSMPRCVASVMEGMKDFRCLTVTCPNEVGWNSEAIER